MKERDVYLIEDFSFSFNRYLNENSKYRVEKDFNNLFSNEPLDFDEYKDDLDLDKLAPNFSISNIQLDNHYFKENQKFSRLEINFNSIKIDYYVKSIAYLLINSGLDFYTLKNKETKEIFTIPVQSDIRIFDV